MAYGSTQYRLDQHADWSSESLEESWNRRCVNNSRILPRPNGHHFVNESQICWPVDQTSGASVLPWSSAARGLQYSLDEPIVKQEQRYLDGCEYNLAYSYPSPPYQCDLSSTYTVSSGSDRRSPYIASPEMPCTPYSPESVRNAQPLFGAEMVGQFPGHLLHGGGSCVAMHNVHLYDHAEYDDDAPHEEEEYHYEPQQPQEVVPMAEDRNDEDCHQERHKHGFAEPMDTHDAKADVSPPVIRKRRAPTQQTGRWATTYTRVNKRPTSRRAASNKFKVEPDLETPEPATRAFPCPLAPYGCSSSFGAKNEWKRHAFTQHFRLGYWRCDQCSGSPKKPNDFNRKDLYVQHVRRMHPILDSSVPKPSKKSRVKISKSEEVEEALNAAAERCYRKLRDPPTQSCCLFCDDQFTGKATFESRMEHIGRHMERAKKGGKELARLREWHVDAKTEEWMLEHGLLAPSGRNHKLVLADGSE